MDANAKIYVAGHTGLVGSAILRNLEREGYSNFVLKTIEELDLTDQKLVDTFLNKERPEYVFLAAAKVGGIVANNTCRGQFIYENLMIQSNVITLSGLIEDMMKNDLKLMKKDSLLKEAGYEILNYFE